MQILKIQNMTTSDVFFSTTIHFRSTVRWCFSPLFYLCIINS